MPALKPVSEKSLVSLVEFDVVVHPQILLTDGGYIFTFRLRTKEAVLAMQGHKVTNLLDRSTALPENEQGELYSLYGTQKLRPRTWKSMDRMIRWFFERGMLADVVSLQIAQPVSVHISTSTIRSSS